MGLETKSLAELEELASNLRKQIALNPDHSAMEKVEWKMLKDGQSYAEKKLSPAHVRMTTLRSRENALHCAAPPTDAYFKNAQPVSSAPPAVAGNKEHPPALTAPASAPRSNKPDRVSARLACKEK